MATPRVVVVGAGPAGVRASETLAAAGLRPVVVDESAASGGQIYRRQPQAFKRSADRLYGTEAGRAISIHSAFDDLASAIDYQPDTLVWNVQDGVLHTVCGNLARQLPFDALILACGATDRLLPLPGWTLPGVFSLGASQVALKAQACAIGKRVTFMGTGPLLYLIAAQYANAGVEVAAVLDTSTEASRLRALPLLASRLSVLTKGGRLLWQLGRAGVPIYRGVTPLKIGGSADVGVTMVTVQLSNGEIKEVTCDAVALGYHLRAETQLADLAGCRFKFDGPSRQWLPEIDADGRSSVPGVYLAGDGVRILGADGAEIAGRLAALAALDDLGIPAPVADRQRLYRSQKQMDRFRRGLAVAFPLPSRLMTNLSDDTLVCRCEAITVGALRQSALKLGANEVNRAKAFSRVGMGRCQGRYCGLASAEILAAALGERIEDVGRLRGQAPIKPLPVSTEGTPS